MCVTARGPQAMPPMESSALTEFLRNSACSVCNMEDSLPAEESAVCKTLRKEVSAGARDEAQMVNLRRMSALAAIIPAAATFFDPATAMDRSRRHDGFGRVTTGLLTAPAAIREGGPYSTRIATPASLIDLQPRASTAFRSGTHFACLHSPSQSGSRTRTWGLATLQLDARMRIWLDTPPDSHIGLSPRTHGCR